MAILHTIQRAQSLCPDRRIDEILGDLGLPKATYHRWCDRAADSQLTDHVVVPRHEAVPPTPEEARIVRD
jgi:hypothetical protein